MPTALDSLILFIAIIIPGITFRRFYFQGEFTKQFNSRTLTHGLIESILPGILIQLVTIFIFKSQEGLKSNNLISVYNGFSNNNLPSNFFNKDVLVQSLIYLAILLGLSILFANLSYRIVRITGADRWSTILRFSNHWNYYFTGEIKDFPEYKKMINGNVLEVRADILLRVQNMEPRLYSGIVKQHTLQKESLDLKNIYLTNVSLYKKMGVDEKKTPVKIPGDIMILNAEDIININMRYITAPKKILKVMPGLTIIFFFVGLLFIVLTDFRIYNASTLLKTSVLKTYFIFYLLFITTLIEVIITPPKTSQASKKSAIQGLVFLILFMTIFYIIARIGFIRAAL